MSTDYNNRINNEFLELIVSSRFEIKNRLEKKQKYLDVTDKVIGFVKANKDSIATIEFGIFLSHFASFNQLNFCLDNFEFSDMQKDNLIARKDALNKRYQDRKAKKIVEQKTEIVQEMAFANLSFDEMIANFAKSDTKDYIRYINELTSREQNAKTYSYKKQAKQTKQVIDAITKCYNKKQEINVDAIKEQYFGKQEAQIIKKREKYSPEHKEVFTKELLSNHVNDLVTMPKKNIDKMITNIVKQSVDNIEEIDLQLVSDFILKHGDLQWNNYYFCKKLSGHLSPEILGKQQKYLMDHFEDNNQRKSFYRNFASVKGVNVAEFERKFLECGEHLPIDIVKFAKEVKDADLSMLGKYINVQMFESVKADDFKRTMAWEKAFGSLENISDARKGTKRKNAIEDAIALEDYKQSLQQPNVESPVAR